MCNDNENTTKIPKEVFHNLVNAATKESFFMFNKFYKQIDVVAMGSTLNPDWLWLQDCHHVLRPVFYRQYVNDIFVLFSCLDHGEKFKKYCPRNIPNINFSVKKALV